MRIDFNRVNRFVALIVLCLLFIHCEMFRRELLLHRNPHSRLLSKLKST